MLKKVVIPVVILAIASVGYKAMNTSSSQPFERPEGAAQSEKAQPEQRSNQQGDPKQDDKPTDATESAEASSTPATQNSAEKTTATADSEKPKTQTKQRGLGGGMRSGVLAKQGATSVDIVPAVMKKSVAQIDLFGIIAAQQNTIISASSNAKVLSINVSEGQLVQSAQSIVSLEASSTLEALQQRQAALTELEARIRNEKLKHANDQSALDIDRELLRITKNGVDRFTSLNSKQLTSGSDYEAALRTYQSQLLSVQGRELTLAQFNDQLQQYEAQKQTLLSQIRQATQLTDDLNVSSSFDGLVAKVSVNKGQVLRTGDAIAEIYNPQSLVLYVRVPLRYRLDQFDLTELQASDKNGQRWVAQSIRPVNESGAQRLTLTPAQDENIKLLPGTHVSLRLQYPVTKPAVEVPVTAVYDQQRVYVFEQGVIRAVDMQILGRSDNGYLIYSEEFNPQTMIVSTRLKNPITGMAVSTIENSGERKR